MPYLARRHRNLQGRRRGVALASSCRRLTESAAALDAYCARINPGLRIIAPALTLLVAGIVAQQSRRAWLGSSHSSR